MWNSLPKYVVLCDTVNTFKARLDKLWQDQEVVMIIGLKFTETEVEVVIDLKLL